jgi:hypothetical protein
MVVLSKRLGDPIERDRRLSQLLLPHVAALTEFVETLRVEKGERYAIPISIRKTVVLRLRSCSC